MGVRFTLLSSLAAAAAALCPPAGAVEETACRLALDPLPAAFAKCSELAVPLDPARPDGPRMTLFVARVESATATPAADPLVLIAGGPGQSTVDFYLQMREAFEPLRRDRDIVLLDQRGTGRSAAGFECDVPEDLELETAEPALLDALIGDCLANFEHSPKYLTTSAATADLERLRAALGAEAWNLYGVSYGTRVAQHYMKRHPKRVRAAILDGVVPTGTVLGLDTAANAQQALDGIFARCAASSACDRRFGDLPAKFDALRARLADKPVNVALAHPLTGRLEATEFTGAHLQAVVRLMSYDAATAALLPLVLDEAHERNYQPIAGQAAIVLRSVANAFAFPMHNSVVCTEDVAFYPSAAERASRDAGGYLGTAIVDSLVEICARWPSGPIDEDFMEPLETDRPVLLLSGSLDPATPAAYGERSLEQGLTQAVHLVAPGQGHGLAGVGCVPRLMRDFVRAADPAAVDGECLSREPPLPFFLSFQGPAP